MRGRGSFEEAEVEDGCWRLTDEAAALSKRRRSQKRDKATTHNDVNCQYTTIKQNMLEVGGKDCGVKAGGDSDDAKN